MENHGIFERYLNGSMPETEKTDFLRRLSEDQVFNNEFLVYNEVNSVILNMDDRDGFKKALNEAESKYFESVNVQNPLDETNIRKHRIMFYKIAASVVIVVTLSVMGYYMLFSKYTKKELYAQYYMPLKMDAVSRSADDSLMNIERGFIAYQDGRYKECIQILSSGSYPDNVSVNLVKGLSFMELGNFKMAETFLLLASKDESNGLHDDCQWYLSLTYIQLEKPAQAASILKKLIENKSVYEQKAEKLLKEIN